jgi:hypothetical protein
LFALFNTFLAPASQVPFKKERKRKERKKPVGTVFIDLIYPNFGGKI